MSNLNNIGLLPPQALELEQAVLGAAMIEADGCRLLLSLVKTHETFYDPKHQLIFKAIQRLNSKNSAIDISMVVMELRSANDLELVGGPFEVVTLTNRVNSAANMESHIRVILEQFTKRRIIKAGTMLTTQGYANDSDALTLLAEANKILTDLTDQLSIKRPRFLAELLPESLKRIEDALEQKGLTGVPSGIRAVDRLTGGFQPGNLIIIAGRPGMGKTTLALNFARNAALDFNSPAAFFSLEMGEQELVTKLIATETGYTTSTLTRGQLPGGVGEFNYLKEKAYQTLNSHGLIIDDTSGLTIPQLRAKASIMKAESNIQMIVVDYLQLMRGDAGAKGNREQEIGSISRGLKLIAKELKIPVIALSQLSRSVEQRGGDKKPMLSDLRESGSIEQDADMVIFAYRAEYYGIAEDANGNSTANTAELIIAKHRNGPLDDLILGCKMATGRFYDLGEDLPPPTPHSALTALPNSTFDETPF